MLAAIQYLPCVMAFDINLCNVMSAWSSFTVTHVRAHVDLNVGGVLVAWIAELGVEFGRQAYHHAKRKMALY